MKTIIFIIVVLALAESRQLTTSVQLTSEIVDYYEDYDNACDYCGS